MTQKPQKPQKIEKPKKISRARKTSETPTRIYSYRLLPPITNQDLVERQFLLANQFRNALVEIDHWMWDRFREIWIADPRVRSALLHYQDASGSVDDAYDELRAAKSGVADPDLSVPLEHLAAAKELLEIAGEELRAAKDRAKKRDQEAELADPIVGPLRQKYEETKAAEDASAAEKERVKELRKQLREEWRAARREAEDAGRLPIDSFRLVNETTADKRHAAERDYASRGLRHAAYMRIEKAMEQAAATTKGPLLFERYDGTGSIGTQLTETGAETRKAVDPELYAAKERTKKLDREAELADPVVGLARRRYEEAKVAKIAKGTSAEEKKHLKRLRKQLREEWQSARREAEDAGRLSASDADGIGMTLPELLSGLDTRLRVGLPGESDKHPRAEIAGKKWSEISTLPRNVRRHAARTYVDLRVGSDGQEPIFARFPVTLHRLPPKDSVIKWAYVVRKRIGHRYEWQLQLTLESSTFDRPPVAIGEGACAINLGWRRIIDDQGEAVGLRAGYVVDELGRDREIRVPDYCRDRRRGIDKRTGLARPAPNRRDPATRIPVLAAIGKCDDLAAIRDKSLESAQLSLSQWLSARGGVPEIWTTPEAARPDGSIPKTMAEKLRGYSAWRAAWKLRRFMDQWRTRRIEGDDSIFTELCAWAKQDRHLETWQASQRDGVIAHRRETWRVIATELARKYATIVVGESKLTDIDGWEKKKPEDGDPSEGREQRRMSRICAPGELRAEIEKAAAKTGARVIRHEEKRATQECYYCGHDEPWDPAPRIEHACGGCGRTWDQDANYCRNLLKRSGHASGDAPTTGGGPLAVGKPRGSRRSAGSAGSDAAMQMSPVRS